ncbi:MAG: hypothetical protein ACYC2T_10540 [Bacillota bacterium]
MEDHELERRLRDSRQTFAKHELKEWTFTALMRTEVHNRAAAPGRDAFWQWSRTLRGAFAALVVGLVVIGLARIGQIAPNPASATTVQQDEVDMDGSAPFELVRLLRVYPEEGNEAAYVTTVWGGVANEQLIYNQVLAAGSQPMSLQALALLGSPKQMVMVSALGPEGGLWLDLMSYDGQKVKTYRGEGAAAVGSDDHAGPARLVSVDESQEFSSSLPTTVWVVWTRLVDGEVRFSPTSEIVMLKGESLLILGNTNIDHLPEPALLPDGVLEHQDMGFIASRPGQTMLKLVPAVYPGHSGELKVNVLLNNREELR